MKVLEITSHDGVVIDEGKRRKDWNESFGCHAVLTQLGEPGQLGAGKFVEVVPADAVDEYQEQLVRCGFRQGRLNECEEHDRRQCADDEDAF